MSHFKLYRRAVLAFFLTTTVTACGFHLRGNIPLPDGIKSMYVVAPDGGFKEKLEDALVKGGALLAETRAGAAVVLNMLEAAPDRTIGTLDERGKVNSYNLVFNVKYQLTSVDGTQIRDASLKESRRYDFDPELVIEAETEEFDLLDEMEQTIALRVVRQLSSVTNYPPASTSTSTSTSTQ